MLSALSLRFDFGTREMMQQVPGAARLEPKYGGGDFTASGREVGELKISDAPFSGFLEGETARSMS